MKRISELKTYEQMAKEGVFRRTVLDLCISHGILKVYSAGGKMYLDPDEVLHVKGLYEQARNLSIRDVSEQIHGEIVEMMKEGPSLTYDQAYSCINRVAPDLMTLYRLVSFVQK